MFPKKQKNKLTAKSYQLEASSGFTLIEILLVTFIAGLVFVAIYMLYAMTIKQDVESRYEIIASNLAQEGIEIIRNARDENILAENDIDDGFPAVCRPRLHDLPLSPCGNPATTNELAIENASGRYVNCQGICAPPLFQTTPFERSCSITASNEDAIPGNDQLVVICTVSWDSFAISGTRQIQATSVLTDWDAD